MGLFLLLGPQGLVNRPPSPLYSKNTQARAMDHDAIEDPVEYEVSGVNQTQVNSEIGFHLPVHYGKYLARPRCHNGGEIRDRETADIAIRASLTGHLVLSTLHTNDAPGAIPFD